MHDGNHPCDLASESPARSRLVHRAREPFTRAVRGLARWCRGNRHRSLPEQQAALGRKLRERYACCGHSGSAPRRWTPSSSLPVSPTSTRRSGSPMSSPASPNCRAPRCASRCPGTRKSLTTRPLPQRSAATSRCFFDPPWQPQDRTPRPAVLAGCLPKLRIRVVTEPKSSLVRHTFT